MRKVLIVALLFSIGQIGVAQDYKANSPVAGRNILMTAQAESSLHLFLTAVRLSGLAPRLNGSDHVTVFAFTDQAFMKLSPKLQRQLMETPKLFIPILTHYMISGDLKAHEFGIRPELKSEDGLRFSLEESGGRMRAQKSEIGRTDILCSNGVIHILDSLDTAYIQLILIQQQP